jgi:rare lipoprotein A (peptidoglycan hydrolase)
MRVEPWQLRSVSVVVGCTVLVSACSLLPKGNADLDLHHRALGLASWYGAGFHGRLTATGEAFVMYELTAAHRTLPFNTLVRVINLANGRQVSVRINDRGPYVQGRILDLSYAAAQELDMLDRGISAVSLVVMRPQTAPHQDIKKQKLRELAELGPAEPNLRHDLERVRYFPRHPEDVWFQRRPRYQTTVPDAGWPL